MTPALPILDPVERLQTCMERNILLVAEERSKEVTIILHEHNTLTGEARATSTRARSATCGCWRRSFAEAMREAASARCTLRWRRSRSWAWCRGRTSGSGATARSPREEPGPRDGVAVLRRPHDRPRRRPAGLGAPLRHDRCARLAALSQARRDARSAARAERRREPPGPPGTRRAAGLQEELEPHVLSALEEHAHREHVAGRQQPARGPRDAARPVGTPRTRPPPPSATSTTSTGPEKHRVERAAARARRSTSTCSVYRLDGRSQNARLRRNAPAFCAAVRVRSKARRYSASLG